MENILFKQIDVYTTESEIQAVKKILDKVNDVSMLGFILKCKQFVLDADLRECRLYACLTPLGTNSEQIMQMTPSSKCKIVNGIREKLHTFMYQPAFYHYFFNSQKCRKKEERLHLLFDGKENQYRLVSKADENHVFELYKSLAFTSLCVLLDPSEKRELLSSLGEIIQTGFVDEGDIISLCLNGRLKDFDTGDVLTSFKEIVESTYSVSLIDEFKRTLSYTLFNSHRFLFSQEECQAYKNGYIKIFAERFEDIKESPQDEESKLIRLRNLRCEFQEFIDAIDYH